MPLLFLVNGWVLSTERLNMPLMGFIRPSTNGSLPRAAALPAFWLLPDTPLYTETGSMNLPGSPMKILNTRAEAFICPLFWKSMKPLLKSSGFLAGTFCGVAATAAADFELVAG